MILVAIALCVVIGPSMAVGIASLILFAPIIQRITNKMMEIRRQRVKVTDKRVEIVNAMLQGIKVTKLNNYESKYIERMKEIRREELALLRKELYTWSTVMAVQFISPVLASAVAFTAYVLLGNMLTASDAFTALLLFNALRFPINYASRLVGKVAQARESARRIAIFLRREVRTNDSSVVVEGAVDDREIGNNSTECNGDSRKKFPSHILEVDRDKDQSGNVISETSSTSEEIDSSRCDSISPLGRHTINDKDPLLVVKDGVFRIGGTSSFDDEQTCGLGSDGSYTIRGVNMSVRPGEILAIVGPVGSGKSSIINAIIGEVSVSPSTTMVRRGKVAYASQVAFILNSTVRENILFGSAFDAARYNQVLDACCLREDIKQLSHGDLTEIGERGVTLSGGQKQRVSLARVVYSNPDIALFDDPLSALDAGTARMVFERLFEQSGNKLLANTATVLVTHASHFLNRVNEIMVVVNGSIPFSGSWDNLMEVVEEDPKAKLAIDSIRTAVQEDGNEQDNTSGQNHSMSKNTQVDGFKKKMINDNARDALMTTETREHGLTQIWAWLLWFQQGGGTSFTLGILVLFVLEKLFYFGTEWWIAFWAHGCDQEMQALGITFPPQSGGVPAQYGYLAVYGILLVLAFICAFVRTLWIVTGGIRCSKNLYEEMTNYVLHAPMSFFETTPMGRLLNRFTYDAEILDVTLVWSMSMLLIALSWFLTALVVMVVILPWMIIVMLPVTLCYWLIQVHYRKSGADLHRLDALSRSPLQAMLSEGIEGAATIRTFHKEDKFISRFHHFADKNTSAQMNFLSAQRWLGIRIELLGAAIVFIASILVISFNGALALNAGIVALLIRWSSGLTISLSFLVDNVAEAEGAVTAIERISRMTETPQETDFEKKGDTVVDSSWPTKGELEFRDVKLRYRPRLPLALKGLSFRVEAGQHCGVVGRTGAGKSTLATALFRLVEIESGRISVDNVNLSKLGLSDVRGRPNGIAIIPQDPFLFAGTLRECLDPFGISSDEKLLDALASVRMLSSGRGIEYLDSRVEEGGANYSVGERSLLVLARAILAKPKLLLMDEATANIDGETDSFIQKMLRTRFRSTTLLTIAHRLDTIMDYDKILVMADGKLAEFGSPVELIEENGLLRELVDATGEGAASLIQMARSAAEEKERERQDRGLFD
jgi:ABC-type multidrug transport system fused ATPase/permease subunit